MRGGEIVCINGANYIATPCERSDFEACIRCHFSFEDKDCEASPACWVQQHGDISVVYLPLPELPSND